MNLQVNEIFASIQGEGYWTGLPCVFLRLQGCNLDPPCAWCDTPQAQGWSTTKTHNVMDVMDIVNSFKPCTVVVTGGEPMMQSDALKELIRLDMGSHRWHLETNGTIKIPNMFQWVTISPKYGQNPPVIVAAYADELKFVIAYLSDISSMPILNQNDYPYLKRVWLQPVSNDPEMIKMCVDWLLSIPSSEQLFGLSVQVHKLIGVK